MNTPLTPILEGYEPLTGEELVSARECAHVGYTTPLMVQRLLQTIATRDETIAGLKDALTEFVYETTHLSREEDDGSHWCRIPKATLEKGRAALSLRANVEEPVGREELTSIIHQHLASGRGGNSVIAADAIIQKFAGRRISHD